MINADFWSFWKKVRQRIDYIFDVRIDYIFDNEAENKI